MKPAILLTGTVVSLASALMLQPNFARAQPYPAKPIRIIVPFTPGGATDTAARIMAQALGNEHGWRFVVENRPGASGRIGTEVAARAPPDGYTLLMGSVAPNAIIPSAVANLPYDAVKDFAPITLLATSDYILAVHPSLPVKSVKDLIALTRSKPGQVNFASVGNISGAHMAGELFKQLAKVNIVHVPYKGPSAGVVAVLSGEVSFHFASGPTVLPHAKDGKVRLLASSGAKRSKFTPTLPAINETLPGHEATQWFAIMAPAGTSKDIIARLHPAIVTMVGTPKVIEQFAAVGSEPVGGTPEELMAFIKVEITKWSKVVKSGVSLD